MSGTFDDTNRQAIPRCLDYSTACALGLLRIARERGINIKSKYQISRAINKWQENPNIYTATDLLAEALILKDFESKYAIEAADHILNKSKTTNTIIKELASHFLEQPEVQNIQAQQIGDPQIIYPLIADLKKTVRFYGRNSIAWCDMALYYAKLAQIDKARKAIQIALNLAPDNRFILRSASGCFNHLGEPDRAVSILRRSPRHLLDPWITSADIAISESADLSVKSLSKAKDLVKDDNLTQFSRSELAVSIGTKEMRSGAGRRAKVFMRQGIIDPTENALAQAEWMATRLGTNINNFVHLEEKVPASFEANARHFYYLKKFEKSLDSAEHWCTYQPISSVPYIFSSYIASVCLGDDMESVRILESALQLNRTNPTFMNNYICSLAKTGNIEAAIENFRTLNLGNLTDDERFTFLATQGLIYFRTNNPEKGRELYLKAMAGFERINEQRSAAIAAYYWALEEKLILSSYKEACIKDAISRVKHHNVFELDSLIKKL